MREIESLIACSMGFISHGPFKAAHGGPVLRPIMSDVVFG